MTGQTKNRLLRIGLCGVNNLPPGAGSHGLAVEAFLPVSVLFRVAAPAGLGTEGGLFLRKARWRRALQRDRGLPVVLKKAVDVQLQRKAWRGLRVANVHFAKQQTDEYDKYEKHEEACQDQGRPTPIVNAQLIPSQLDQHYIQKKLFRSKKFLREELLGTFWFDSS